MRPISSVIAGLCAGLVLALGSSTVRGEVVTRVALLNGMQETPPVSTTAKGCGRFVIDTDANTLDFEIVYWGLSSAETAAHIHGMAGPGAPAGVIFPLPAGTVKRGTWNYAEAQEANILGGFTYVNIHSANFGGGEIRGQIVAAVCDMDGGQEVPPNPSGGQGFGLFNIDPVAHTLSYYIAFTGLTAAETACHIHGYAHHTVAAGIVHPLPLGGVKTGVWAYPAAEEQRIIDGMTYVNIHSANFGGGEIRGQIVTWLNPMNGARETPPNATSSAGCAMISINRGSNIMGHDIRVGFLTSPETAAHIHGYADAGVPAGVVQPLAAGARKLGTWTFGAANQNNILLSRTYVNIHTMAFGGGEIRGQIWRGRPIPCSPLVTDQPDDFTATAPGFVHLMVMADERNGGPIQYEWRRNNVPVPNAPPFFGADTNMLMISPSDPAHSGSYRCVMTNTCGTTVSDEATVVVLPPCDPDVNCDGSINGFDIEATEQAVNGDFSNFCQASADLNGDGAENGFDIETEEQRVNGAPC
ncbi:hypothetical protein PHYC_01986 [Phycisphaerales bacterium]|nr:hypothetical protein PHYC_01986 [Phycisphaerales bacterium]